MDSVYFILTLILSSSLVQTDSSQNEEVLNELKSGMNDLIGAVKKLSENVENQALQLSAMQHGLAKWMEGVDLKMEMAIEDGTVHPNQNSSFLKSLKQQEKRLDSLFNLLNQSLSTDICHKSQDGTACNESLGMGDGRIGDSQLSSNSVWRNMAGHAVVKGRYYPGVAGKGWCADVPVLDDVWYQIDFQKVVNTTGLILKGGSASERIQFFTVQYSKDGYNLDNHIQDPETQLPKKFIGTDAEWYKPVTRYWPATEMRVMRIHTKNGLPDVYFYNYCGHFEVLGCSA